MKREIYEVYAKVVDASGAYNNLTGYPQSFDSHQNNDDLNKAYGKAQAAYHSACNAGYTASYNGRPLTVCGIIRISDGMEIEKTKIGNIPDIPDPEPEPQPEPEPEEPEEPEHGGE